MNEQATPPDFSSYFLQELGQVLIDLPNGNPMLYQGERVVVHVYGPSTEQFVAAKDALDREAARNVMATVNGKAKKDGSDKEADARFLTAVTAGIDNFPYPGGPGAVYREPKLKYIAEQVRAHLGDLGNFFAASASA